jgi:hypothetical protein
VYSVSVEEFYFAVENRDEVGYESCVGSLERSDMSGTLYTEIQKQQTEGHDFTWHCVVHLSFGVCK